MIEFNDGDVTYTNITDRLKVVFIFKKLQLDFKKHGKGKTLSWVHRNSARIGRTSTGSGMHIVHPGRVTVKSFKKLLEKYLNYRSSRLKHLIVRSQFE
jgi:hypothetical protein